MLRKSSVKLIYKLRGSKMITEKAKVIEIKKSSLLVLLKYIVYALIFFIFSKAKIMNVYSPTFYGFYLSLLFLGENIFYLSLSFLFASVISNVTVGSIIFSLICVGVGGLIAFLYKKKTRAIKLWEATLYTFLMGLALVYLKFESVETMYISFIDIILNTLFALSTTNFLKIMKRRKFNLNLNVDELVCGGVVLALFFCGLQSINVIFFDIVKFFGLALIMFGGFVLPSPFSIVLGVLGGLGAYLCSGTLEYITLLSIIAVTTYIFKSLNRIYQVLVLFLCDVLLNVFLGLFGGVNVFTFIPTLIVGALYLFTPKSFLSKLRTNVFLYKETKGLKNILNQNKSRTSKRLLYTSEIFYEMDKSFRKLVKGGLDKKNAKSMLCSEVMRENCETCKNKSKCIKGYSNELKKIFENLINVGFEKGRITLIDLPQYLTLRCVRLNQVVNSINSLLSDYKSYAKMNAELDSSKLLIAEQLKGVSHILKELSNETQEKAEIDEKLEKKIKEALIYNDIIPSEIVCFEKDEKTSVVSLIIRTIDFDNEKILKVLNETLQSKMVLDEILPTTDSSLTFATYTTSPTFDMALGVAKTTKGGSESSGDTHSMVKLPSNKYMLAICDSMGSGVKASEKSETSLSIIENFYKAGYDDETIISSLNRLLNLTSENVFSALDVSVIDLKSGEADFIKQGGTVGYIKKGEEVSRIESSSLPLGILEDVSLKVTKTVLTPDDFVIMLSDGVVDALGTEVLEEYLKFLPNKSPQEIADCILNKAKLTEKNYPNDDMTVLVGRLYYTYA